MRIPDFQVRHLLDHWRYLLPMEIMTHVARFSVKKFKGTFPMTICCVNGGMFDGIGPAPEKPFADTVLTLLASLTTEARNSEPTEGEVQRGIRTLVAPRLAMRY